MDVLSSLLVSFSIVIVFLLSRNAVVLIVFMFSFITGYTAVHCCMTSNYKVPKACITGRLLYTVVSLFLIEAHLLKAHKK